jgi:glycosyltransferase involved in cell wall biosynthesis
MDWLPNVEGVSWLLEEVWPRVMKKNPGARLHLAGNKMPRELMDTRLAGVTITGRVKDADQWMAQRHVMVVPLFSAGGMRVKIIEGMAMGRAVISTPVGAEGIDCTDDQDIMLARTPTEFAERIMELAGSPDRVRALGRNARALVRSRYSDRRVVGDLLAFYRTLLKA